MTNLKSDDVECYKLKNRSTRLKGLADVINLMLHTSEIELSLEEISYIDKAFDIVLIHLGRLDRILNKRFDEIRERQIEY